MRENYKKLYDGESTIKRNITRYSVTSDFLDSND